MTRTEATPTEEEEEEDFEDVVEEATEAVAIRSTIPVLQGSVGSND